MQRLTLAERVEHFKLTFPKYPPAWPRMVEEKGLPVFYAVWVGGGDYTNKTRYHGAYPHDLLARLLGLFPDIGPEHTLHAFAGSVPKTKGLRLDLNPATEPDILGNVYDVASLVGDRRFRLACADPPYTAADNRRYGLTGGIDRARATRALASVVAPRGFMTWLDTRNPIYRGDQWRIVGRIYIDRSTGHAIRRLAIFERLSSFVTAGDSANPIRALNTHGQTGTCLEHGAQLSSGKGHAGISPQASGQRDQEAERPAVTNIDCARHRHGKHVDGEPEDHGECVNVPYCCADCGVQLGHVSWTTAAWLAHQATLAKRLAS